MAMMNVRQPIKRPKIMNVDAIQLFPTDNAPPEQRPVYRSDNHCLLRKTAIFTPSAPGGC